jgi:N-acetylglucosamine kinase-like BadF-type ATPase
MPSRIKDEGCSMSKPWVFGIDGGGTSARLRAESLDGEMTMKAESSSMNPRSAGWEGAKNALSFLFAALHADARFQPEFCQAGFAGVAGVGRLGDRENMRSLILEVSGLSCPLSVDTDALPALAGALGSREGILVIAGTGSIALGAKEDGTLVRSGGWGHILGDEGSAFAIGNEGLRAATRYRDGRGLATSLLSLALEHFSIDDPFDLIPAVYDSFDKSAIAGFARKVGQARTQGDLIAKGIFDNAVRELCSLVVSVAQKVGATQGERRIAMTGGLIDNDQELRASVTSELRRQLPDYSIKKTCADPLAGACILARELLDFRR